MAERKPAEQAAAAGADPSRVAVGPGEDRPPAPGAAGACDPGPVMDATPPPSTAAGARSAVPRRPARSGRPVRPWLVVALLGTAAVVVALDQLAKAWAVRTLGDGNVVEVVGSLLQLRLFRNPGAAFSFATGTTWIFTIIAIVVS